MPDRTKYITSHHMIVAVIHLFEKIDVHHHDGHGIAPITAMLIGRGKLRFERTHVQESRQVICTTEMGKLAICRLQMLGHRPEPYGLNQTQHQFR